MKLSNLVLLVAGSLMAGRGLAESADLSLRGPCTPRSHQLRFPVPSELQANKLPAYLSVNVTLPDCGSAAGVQLPFGPAPFPVLFFFNGFMVSLVWSHASGCNRRHASLEFRPLAGLLGAAARCSGHNPACPACRTVRGGTIA